MADAVRRVCGGAADTHAGNFASGTACVPAAHTLRAASPAHRSDYGRRCCYISGIVGWGFPHHGCDCGKPDRTQTVIRLKGTHARVPRFYSHPPKVSVKARRCSCEIVVITRMVRPMADAVRRVCGGAADTHAGNFASGTACVPAAHTLRAEPASGVFMPPRVVFAGNGGWHQAAGSTAAKPSAAATARRSLAVARWWWPG